MNNACPVYQFSTSGFLSSPHCNYAQQHKTCVKLYIFKAVQSINRLQVADQLHEKATTKLYVNIYRTVLVAPFQVTYTPSLNTIRPGTYPSKANYFSEKSKNLLRTAALAKRLRPSNTAQCSVPCTFHRHST